jgi:CDP-diacylglycerol--glycerol-3-phosphate 3-phosphatidyltransferase
VNAEKIKLWQALSWPNRISILRLLLVAPFLALLLHQREYPSARYWALGIFLVMATSDGIDGALARRLNAKTRLGALLDPLADKVLIICAVVLLSLPRSSVEGARLHDLVVVAVVGKDLWVIVGFLVIYLVTDKVRIQPTLVGKACTLGQSMLVASVLLAPEFNRLGSSAGTWIAAVMGWIVAGLCLLAGIGYTRLGLAFLVQDEKPLDESKPAQEQPQEAQ